MSYDKVSRNLRALGFMLSFLLAPCAAFAQSGTVYGVVVDAESGETLIGANVVLEGTAVGSTTDLDGRYEIRNLEAGTYSLVFSYIGYQTTTVQNVAVSADASTELNLSLAPEAIGLDEVVVEAEVVRNAEAALLRDRQKAAAVSDAISAEVISRSASSTAADAMKKVTGATIVGGKYVNVRGLEGRYVNTQLNGAALPSADPDKNAVPFDLFPSALLDNIVTVKTFTPDQPGDFTGGSINIGTKSFPDRETISLSTSVSYESEIGTGDMLYASGGLNEIPSAIRNGGVPGITTAISDRQNAEQLDLATRAFSPIMTPVTEAAPLNQSYSLFYGNRITAFGNRPLGIVASLSYNQDVSGYEGGAVGQYNLLAPFSETDILDADIDLADVAGSREQLFGGLLNLALKPHPKHEVGVNLLYNRGQENFARYQTGLRPRDLQEGQIMETRVLQQIERDMRTVQARGEHVLGSGRGIRMEWNSTLSRTLQDEPDLRIFNSHYDTNGSEITYLISPSIYAKPTRYFRNLEESGWSNDLSIAVPIGSSTVKTGGSYVQRDRGFRERRFQYERTSGYSGNPSTFFGEDIGLQDEDVDDGSYTFGNYIQEVTQASNNYDADLMVAAGFAMIDTPVLVRRLRVIAGVRAEYTDQSVVNSQLRGKIDGLDILPAANLVYALTDRMNARLAYGRTLARPSFREFAPFNAYDFVNSVTIIGNPQLERTIVNNFDARWEWFTRPGEILAASAFYKGFSNPIEQVLSPGAVNREITYQNAEEAKVAGLEFEARTRLDRLAGALQHIQLGGNLTFTQSEVSIDPRELERIRSKNPNASSTRRLQGQSPYVVNLDFGYIDPNQGTTVSLYYNVFGSRLNTVARSGTPDLYEKSRHTLDVVASQRLPFHLEVRASVKNLLNDNFEVVQTFKGTEYRTQQYDIGRSFTLGLKYTL